LTERSRFSELAAALPLRQQASCTVASAPQITRRAILFDTDATEGRAAPIGKNGPLRQIDNGRQSSKSVLNTMWFCCIS
jgi:hypothetical protein